MNDYWSWKYKQQILDELQAAQDSNREYYTTLAQIYTDLKALEVCINEWTHGEAQDELMGFVSRLARRACTALARAGQSEPKLSPVNTTKEAT